MARAVRVLESSSSIPPPIHPTSATTHLQNTKTMRRRVFFVFWSPLSQSSTPPLQGPPTSTRATEHEKHAPCRVFFVLGGSTPPFLRPKHENRAPMGTIFVFRSYPSLPCSSTPSPPLQSGNCTPTRKTCQIGAFFVLGALSCHSLPLPLQAPHPNTQTRLYGAFCVFGTSSAHPL